MRLLLAAVLLLGCSGVTEPDTAAVTAAAVVQDEIGQPCDPATYDGAQR